jgi:nitrogen regulatory protein P-II 1
MTTPSMTVVVAFVQPFQLEPLADALRAVPGFPGMTISDARGFGGARAHVPKPGESGEVDPFRDTVRVEIVCTSAEASRIADAVCRAAHTGHAGDGLVLIAPVTAHFRIRDGRLGRGDGAGPASNTGSE